MCLGIWFAFMKKLVMLRFSGEPKYNHAGFESDSYFLIIKELIRQGVIDYGYLVYTNNPVDKEKKIKFDCNIEVRLLKGVQTDLKNQNFEYFFLRGNYNEFPDFIKQIKAKKTIYYAADSHFAPRAINPKKIDLFFVDEKKYFKDVKKISPHTLPWVIDKPINEKVFKPKKEKIKYDICYVSNFRPWKNHNILFSEIYKLPYSKNLKIICVGNLFMSGFEASGLGQKYRLNVKYTGKVSAEKTASYIRQSKFTIAAGELDASPRTLYESIACNVPVLANSKMTGGLHLINEQTGHKCDLYRFHQGLDYMLKNYKKFKPYEYFKKELTVEKIIQRCFVKPLQKINNTNI